MTSYNQTLLQGDKRELGDEQKAQERCHDGAGGCEAARRLGSGLSSTTGSVTSMEFGFPFCSKSLTY